MSTESVISMTIAAEPDHCPPACGSPPMGYNRPIACCPTIYAGGPPMTSFQCPSCSKKLKDKAEFTGKHARCPHCHKTILVPAAVPSDVPAGGAGHREDDSPRSPHEVPSISEVATQAPSDPNLAGGDTHSSGVGHRGADSRRATHEAHLIDFLAPPQAADELGRLGGYRVLKVLGHGGMGVVFEAEDPQLC